ncbi:T9SS type A sorting domain-containing protein [Persicitalea jodogahamensis]|nr:T9SS type A sorting domain-containing protein [Persicitalea jodogahamensis]
MNKVFNFLLKVTLLLGLVLITTASHFGIVTCSTAEGTANSQEAASKAALDPARRIPIDPTRWYILNNTTSNLAGLFDGETQKNVQLGYGLVLNTYDAYYPLREGESMSIDHIRMFDFEDTFVNKPARLSVITSDWKRVPLATFTGSIYNDWVGPSPDRKASGDAKFSLDTPVQNIRYLVLTIQGGLPTELELYGDYKPGSSPPVTPTVRPIKLRDMLGVNAYEWNFLDPDLPSQIVEPKMELAKSFSGIRHYMDWQRLESTEGVFSYSPTLSGGWHYDKIYERCKADGIEVLACLKTLPDWMLATYPAAERDAENVPVRYGRPFDNPTSYLEQARVAFQYAARYGSNKGVDPKLLSVYEKPRWPGDQPNTVRIGTDLIKYIECDNERDKWWKGRKAYQTAREYAANMSAFYDGHKNSMGAGVGVKNADPNMKVVIGGLVSGADYVRAMVDWCKEFRGYKANGQVNLCWDVINYHIYTDNASSSQSGTSTRGAAPERSNAGAIADAFIRVSDELCDGLPVWITETGFDINQQSPIKAIPIGQKSPLITQADWILRTSLFSARHGIQRVFFYQMYDDNESGTMFSTSGLLNTNGTRRPAADYLRQTKNLFGAYYYVRTLNQNPIVDEYAAQGTRMYALVVPDEVGRTALYDLPTGNASVARVYRPTAGRDDMAWTDVTITNGKARIEVGETPVFVVLDPPDTPPTLVTGVNPLDAQLELIVYPNPVINGQFRVRVNNEGNGEVLINIFSASSGHLHKQVTLPAGTKKIDHFIDLSKLPAGEYILELRQNEKRAFKKVVNLN